MPVTPFHMGPAMLLKVVLRGGFSLMVFGWTQILMDIQPLLVIITGKGHLHGFTHTFVGGSLIAVIAAITSKPLIEACIRSRRFGFAPSDRALLGIAERLGWPVVIVSAAIGAASHVYLDAIMHSDLQPFYPFDTLNPWLGLLSVDMLHQFCVYTGLIGTALYLGIQVAIRRRHTRTD